MSKSKASELLAELKAAVAAGSGRGWLPLTEENVISVFKQFNATSVAELLANQAEYVSAEAYFVKTEDPAEGQKGCKYSSIAKPMAGIEGGLTALDWTGKITSPYATGTVRTCTKEGIIFWSTDSKQGKYEPGFYYRVARKGESRAYVKTALAKKPS